MWKTHARHLPLLCPAPHSSFIPAPSSFVVRLTLPSARLPIAGIPPVQQKRYAKLFIRIAPQGELKGAGQAPRGVQQFKKICLCVCLCVCVSLSVCVRAWVSATRTSRKKEPSQAKPCRAEPGSAHVNLLWLLLLLSKRKLELCHQCVSDSFYSWLIWIITDRERQKTRSDYGDPAISWKVPKSKQNNRLC